MDSILSNVKLENVKSKKFLEVQNKFDHQFDIELLKSEPVYEDLNHNYFNQLKYFEKNQSNLNLFKTSFIGHCFQLSETDSEVFLKKCKENQSSVQGVLSAAKMISLVLECPHLLNFQDRIEILNAVMCDMRYYFGLENDDLIKGAASLYWIQEFGRLDKFWEIASFATKEVNRQKNQNLGLKGWVKINNSIKQPKVYLYATNMGQFSLDENSFKSIKVNDLRFFISTPSNDFRVADDTTSVSNIAYIHAFTYQNKLNMTLSHSFPSLSLEWGRNFSQNFYSIIKQLIENNNDLLVGDILNSLKVFIM